MFENPRRGKQARNWLDNKCSENSRSQIVFRTDIFRKLSLGAPDFLGRCGQFVYIRPQFYPGGWCRRTSTASYQVLSYHLFYHLNTFENDSRKRHDPDRWMQTGLHACVLFVQFWSRKIFIEFESNGIVLKILCVDQLGTPPIANLKAGKISWSYRGGGSTLVISR